MINHRNENALGSHRHYRGHRSSSCTPTSARSSTSARWVWDTRSYSRALRGVVRAAPDVILIGEIRDRESMEAAISLAGTGHLVLATMHANNAAESLDRIINMFPREQHNQIFLDLSQYLRAIMAQRLVMVRRTGASPQWRVMINTPHIATLVKKAMWCRSRKPSPPAPSAAPRASMWRCTRSTRAAK